MNVDNVIQRSTSSCFLPDLSRQCITQDDLALVPQQVLEKLEFTSRQVNDPASATHLARDEIHVEIAHPETQRLGRAPAPQQRAHPRQQLFECKRLDQVIVGAAVEAGDSIFERISRGQQQNRSGDSIFADAGEDLKAITARQHYIKKDDIELLGIDAKEGVLAGVRHHGLVAFIFQALLQRLGDFDFIFDYENTHVSREPRKERGQVTNF